VNKELTESLFFFLFLLLFFFFMYCTILSAVYLAFQILLFSELLFLPAIIFSSTGCAAAERQKNG